jgi:type IV pilus assembly protein PilE
MPPRILDGACQRGFTLIELMVTVAIVAILSAVAYPNFADYVLRSRLIDGTTKLADQRVRMEQYFLDNRRYSTVVGGTVCGVTPVATPNDPFQLRCTATDTTYVAQAVGNTSSTALFTYQVIQDGTKSTATPMPTGWNTTNHTTCWIIRKDGTCG